MRIALALVLAGASLAAARVAREQANEGRRTDATSSPYAPSPDAAPVLSLGYREMAADLLFVRMNGYYPSYDSRAQDTAALAEAIVALDPKFRRVYEFGAIAMTDARRPPRRDLQMRALALLERGMREFPDFGRFPELAGEIYLSDLTTDDAEERRRWDDKGALLFESAARKPGASAGAALRAAELQTRLGKTERAMQNLRELLLIARDERARADIIRRIAEIEEQHADEIAAELLESRRRFESRWHGERPAIPASMYILIGPRLAPGFDLADLATGGRDLIGTQEFERLEPLYDDDATSADGPSSP